MKRFVYLFFIFAITLLLADAYAFKLGNKEMVKNGTGARTKAIIGSVYYATLYVPEELKGKGAAEILDADQPMSVVLLIDTGMLSKDKFVSAIKEGFENASSSGYTTDKVDMFLGMFATMEIKKGDVITFSYIPGAGMAVTHQSKAGTKALGTVPSLAFKKALFAIWIGPKPVQPALKAGMLGGK